MPVFTVPITNMAVFPLVSAAAEPKNAPRAQSQVPTRPGEFTLSCGWCDPHSAVAPAANHAGPSVGEDIVPDLLCPSLPQGVMASQVPCLKRRRSSDDPLAEGDAVPLPESLKGKFISNRFLKFQKLILTEVSNGTPPKSPMMDSIDALADRLYCHESLSSPEGPVMRTPRRWVHVASLHMYNKSPKKTPPPIKGARNLVPLLKRLSRRPSKLNTIILFFK
jgi:hypothetical protein